jgi:hypothetical protein
VRRKPETRRSANDAESRASASPARSASLPPSTSSFEPELQSIAVSKSDEEVIEKRSNLQKKLKHSVLT